MQHLLYAEVMARQLNIVKAVTDAWYKCFNHDMISKEQMFCFILRKWEWVYNLYSMSTQPKNSLIMAIGVSQSHVFLCKAKKKTLATVSVNQTQIRIETEV